MQDKYKIQPLEGHPVPDWTKQYEGSGHQTGESIMSPAFMDLKRFCHIVAGFNAHNPFSMLGKK